MRKIFFAVACMFIISVNSFAQCIPDTSITHNVPGFYPDSATGLPHAIVGVPYSTVMQFKVLTDTNISLGGGAPIHATVDSIIITGVTGLPPNYTYTCTPANCHFSGGSDGCITLFGPAPDTAMAGLSYSIIVNVTAYGHAGFIPAQIPTNINRYRIVVDQLTAVSSLSLTKFDVAQNYPNPFRTSSEISFSSPGNDFLTFKVADLLGKILVSKTVYATKGLNKITLSAKDFEAGIYIYTIGNSKNSITRRMIVSNE